VNNALTKKTGDKVRWFFTDDILDEEGKDKFGHISFVETLEIILSEYTRSENVRPFSIGVFGTWGLGKSTIANFLEKRAEKAGWRTAKINLWKYSSESLRRKILVEIVRKIRGPDELTDLYNKLYKEEEEPVFGGFKNFFRNNKSLAWMLITSIIILFCLTVGVILIIGFCKLPFSVKLALGFTPIAWGGLSYLLGTFFEKITGYTKKVSTKEVTREEEFEELFINKLKHEGKILVFLDDLDRCPADRIIEVLEVVKTYFEIPCLEVVFVVMCDEDRIIKAICKSRLREEEKEDRPSNEQLKHKGLELARNYIDKVFTYQLTVPEFELIDLPSYALEIAEENNYGVYVELAKKGESGKREFRDIIAILITPKIDTPRKVKLILNAFSNAYLLAKDREVKRREETSTVCWIDKNHVTKNLKVLAMVTAIKFLYPRFYELLSKYPAALKNDKVRQALKEGTTINSDELQGEEGSLKEIKPDININKEDSKGVGRLLAYEKRVYGFDVAPFIYFSTERGAMELGTDEYEIIKDSGYEDDPKELKSLFGKIGDTQIGIYLRWYLDVLRKDVIEKRKNRRRSNLLTVLYNLPFGIPSRYLGRISDEFRELIISDYYSEEQSIQYRMSSLDELIRFSEVNEVGTRLIDEAVKILISKFRHTSEDRAALKLVLDRPGLLGKKAQSDVKDLIRNTFSMGFEYGYPVFTEIKDSGNLDFWVDGNLPKAVFGSALGYYLKPTEEQPENDKNGEE